MGLAMFRKFRNLCFADLPGKYHTAGFPADGAAADHSAAEQKVVVGSKIPAHQIFQAFVLGHGAVNNLLFCFFAENTPGNTKQDKEVTKLLCPILILYLS